MFHSATVPGFFRDACTVLGRNTCELLRLAGQDVTIPAVLRFITSMPGDWRRLVRGQELACGSWPGLTFDEVFRLARKRTMGTPDEQRCLELLDYFLIFALDLDATARQMLEQSFIGVLQGVERAANALSDGERPGRPFEHEEPMRCP
jgi:hypothetical protein